MEDIEGLENGDELLTSYKDTDCESSISEEESLLYSLIYHEHQKEDIRAPHDLSSSDQLTRATEFPISSRNKAYRLNEVHSIDKFNHNNHTMSTSTEVRNHIKLMREKLETLKQKHASPVHEKRRLKKACGKLIKTYKISMENSCTQRHVVNTHEDITNERSEDISDNMQQIVSSAEIPTPPLNETERINEKSDKTKSALTEQTDQSDEVNLSRNNHNMNTNTKPTQSSSACEIIILDSDTESVDSVVEVKPPTPPPPVVISIDSSDESQQIRDKSNSIVAPKPSNNLNSAADYIELDTTIVDIIDIDETLPSNDISLVVTYENRPTVLSNISESLCDNSTLNLVTSPSETLVSPDGKNEKSHKKSKHRKKKSREQLKPQCVPHSWTKEMIKFYCESWGGHKFDHNVLLRQMSGNASKWKIQDIDLAGPLPRQGFFPNHRCFNCNQRGHSIHQCPDPIKQQCCLMCGELGHTKRSCPNKICLLCGRPAEAFSYGCRMCFKEHVMCQTCGKVGHFIWQCPDAWRVYHSATTSEEVTAPTPQDLKHPENLFCSNCARIGHLAQDCELPNDVFRENCPVKLRRQNFATFNYKYYGNNFKHKRRAEVKANTKVRKYNRKNGTFIMFEGTSAANKKVTWPQNRLKKIKKKTVSG